MYEIKPTLAALTRASSDSAEVAMTLGYFSLILSIFSLAPGRSALFAIIRLGFAMFRRFLTSNCRSSSSHLPKSGLTVLKASITSSRAIPVPESWSNMTREISRCSASTFLTSLTQFLLTIPYIHMTISCSRNSMSSNGSWEPRSTGFPSSSVEPEASMT